MEFFIPGASSPEQRDSVYEAVKKHLTQKLGAELSARKIQALHYVHDGENYQAIVGQEESGSEGIVVAILFDKIRSLYLVCTPYRGVVSGSPILVGAHDVRAVVDFDA